MFCLLALFVSLASLPLAWGQVKIVSVVNAASLQRGLPTGGALVTVFCSGLTGTPGTYIAPSTLPLPYQLAGVEVTVNNGPAPLLAVVIPAPGQQYGQINFQVPLERNTTFWQQANRTERH